MHRSLWLSEHQQHDAMQGAMLELAAERDAAAAEVDQLTRQVESQQVRARTTTQQLSSTVQAASHCNHTICCEAGW